MSAPAVTGRLSAADLLRVGSLGLRTRRLRAALSALGVAIGIAAMVAVVGVSASSQATLLAEIDRLGTNVLTVQPGQGVFGEQGTLPSTAVPMIDHMAHVQHAAAVYAVSSATVRRTDLVPSDETGGIGVDAADPNLLRTLNGTLASGRFLDGASARLPEVVLGAVAARQLGIAAAGGRREVFLGGTWFTVVGTLQPLGLAPELDRTALVGLPIAARLFGAQDSPSTVYVRTDVDAVAQVDGLLAATADPQAPDEAQVSQPSAALQARAAAKGAFTTLLLGLGAVALLVGGVGIANVMVIAVLERRAEVGLRRALGATRRDIAAQFLAEALVLGAAGGVAGAALGALATGLYAAADDQPFVVPAWSIAAGIAAAMAIGAAAGLYPATRAARLSPTEALRSV